MSGTTPAKATPVKAQASVSDLSEELERLELENRVLKAREENRVLRKRDQARRDRPETKEF